MDGERSQNICSSSEASSKGTPYVRQSPNPNPVNSNNNNNRFWFHKPIFAWAFCVPNWDAVFLTASKCSCFPVKVFHSAVGYNVQAVPWLKALMSPLASWENQCPVDRDSGESTQYKFFTCLFFWKMKLSQKRMCKIFLFLNLCSVVIKIAVKAIQK